MEWDLTIPAISRNVSGNIKLYTERIQKREKAEERKEMRHDL